LSPKGGGPIAGPTEKNGQWEKRLVASGKKKDPVISIGKGRGLKKKGKCPEPHEKGRHNSRKILVLKWGGGDPKNLRGGKDGVKNLAHRKENINATRTRLQKGGFVRLQKYRCGGLSFTARGEEGEIFLEGGSGTPT